MQAISADCGLIDDGQVAAQIERHGDEASSSGSRDAASRRRRPQMRGPGPFIYGNVSCRPSICERALVGVAGVVSRWPLAHFSVSGALGQDALFLERRRHGACARERRLDAGSLCPAGVASSLLAVRLFRVRKVVRGERGASSLLSSRGHPQLRWPAAAGVQWESRHLPYSKLKMWVVRSAVASVKRGLGLMSTLNLVKLHQEILLVMSSFALACNDHRLFTGSKLSPRRALQSPGGPSPGLHGEHTGSWRYILRYEPYHRFSVPAPCAVRPSSNSTRRASPLLSAPMVPPGPCGAGQACDWV